MYYDDNLYSDRAAFDRLLESTTGADWYPNDRVRVTEELAKALFASEWLAPAGPDLVEGAIRWQEAEHGPLDFEINVLQAMDYDEGLTDRDKLCCAPGWKLATTPSSES